MNNYLKKIGRFSFAAVGITAMLLSFMLFMPLHKALALDGDSEDNTIRGFVLPAEQTVSATVNSAEIKEPIQIDFFGIAYIGLIVVGSAILIALIIYWIRAKKRGANIEL